MGFGHYILEGTQVRLLDDDDWLTWARWFETADRVVWKTPLGVFENESVVVSTVFLGLDHNWGSGPPILFETMVFGGPCHQDQWRYSTWTQAEQGHQAVVDAVTAAMLINN